MNSLSRLTVKGFKSIESLVDFELGPRNVLIGANGAGKSNLVDFFRMLRAMAGGGLQSFVHKHGGADGFFHFGPKQTPQISARVQFRETAFEFRLSPTPADGMFIDAEWVEYRGVRSDRPGGVESALAGSPGATPDLLAGRYDGIAGAAYRPVSTLSVYHFHDTSILSESRRVQSVADFERLHEDASNIAAFLLRLRDQRRSNYDLIRETIRSAAPFFDDFLLRPEMKGPAELVRLEWRQKGSDYPFQPWQLSDGTLRFICLATALLQPDPPTLIAIDEPELGLHPSAVGLLASIISSASEKVQVVVLTQSPALVDYFDPEDVVVVDRERGHSLFRRLDAAELKEWLAEYSLGELWEKGVLRGGPGHE